MAARYSEGAESVASSDDLSGRRVSTPDPQGPMLHIPRLDSLRRRSMPVGLESPRSNTWALEMPVMEDISSVTIKARRGSENAGPADSLAPPAPVTLRLRRWSTLPGGDPEGGVMQLSLSAAMTGLEEHVIGIARDAPPHGVATSIAPTICVEAEPPLLASASAAQKENIYFLEHTWSVWFDETVKAPAPLLLGSFNTVQGFWSYWNNLSVGMLRSYVKLSLFKQGPEPGLTMPTAPEGGRWVVWDVPKVHRVKCWSQLVLRMVGEQLDGEGAPAVAGAVLRTSERGDAMELWMTRPDHPGEYSTGTNSPLVEILPTLLPEDSTLQWVFRPPLDTRHDPELRRTFSRPDSFRSVDEEHPFGRSVPRPPDDFRRPTSGVSGSVSAEFLRSTSLSSVDAAPPPPMQMRPAGLMPVPMLSLPHDPRLPRSPECLSPGVPLAGELSRPMPPGHDPGGHLEDSCQAMAAALERQRQVLHRKLVQISCLLNLQDQIRARPGEVAPRHLADLVEHHLTQPPLNPPF